MLTRLDTRTDPKTDLNLLVPLNSPPFHKHPNVVGEPLVAFHSHPVNVFDQIFVELARNFYHPAPALIVLRHH